jgi:hypothetical protein
MQVRHHQIAVLNRVVYLAKLRATTLGLFDHGATPIRIRASEVAKEVARELEIENSPWFRLDLTQALQAAGWRDIRTDNVRYWKGVRRR